MNISVPDALHERLDRLRDRVNASRVCAKALEKELDMLERGSALGALADPDIAKLLQRLQGARDQWYQHGREDGRRWAVTDATREDLWRVTDDLASDPGEEIAQLVLHHEHGPRPWLLTMFDFKSAMADAARRESSTTSGASAPPDEAEEEAGERQDWTANPTSYSGSNGTRTSIDEAAYMEGWRDVVVEIWKAVAPALRR